MNLQEYYAIICDAWHLLKSYIPEAAISGTADEFWQQLIKDAGDVAKKHNHSRFVKNLVLLIEGEIEEVYKDGRK